MLNKASMALIRLVILCHGTRFPSFSNSPVYFSFLMQAFISPRLDKTIEKPLFQWLTPAKTIDSDGDKIPKPSLFHRWRKRTITIPSPWKFDHCPCLFCILSIFKHRRKSFCFFSGFSKTWEKFLFLFLIFKSFEANFPFSSLNWVNEFRFIPLFSKVDYYFWFFFLPKNWWKVIQISLWAFSFLFGTGQRNSGFSSSPQNWAKEFSFLYLKSWRLFSFNFSFSSWDSVRKFVISFSLL